MEPVVGFWLMGIWCKLCLVVMEVVVAAAKAGSDAPISTSIVAEVVLAKPLAHVLVSEGCL
jgi:hypothetical protein